MSDSEFDEISCDHVLQGTVGRVIMAKAVTSEFLSLQSRQQARLLSNAKLWADGQRPHADQFQGNEGRCGGKNDRMLVAVKVHKVRLYGFVRQYKGSKCLIIVDIDADKKRDKANPRALKRAKRLAVEMDDLCGG